MLRKLLLLCAAVICAASTSEAAENITLGIVRFSSTPELIKITASIMEAFTRTVDASETITILHRSKIDNSLSSDSDLETVSKFGRSKGCKYILLGSVRQEKEKDITVSVRAVEVRAAQVIFSLSAHAHASDSSSLRAESIKLGESVRENLAGEYPQVSGVKGKDITINRGSSSGVKKGDLFRVYREQYEVVDREGSSSGRLRADMAVIEVKTVKKDASTAQLFKNGGDEQIIPSLNGSRVEAISRRDAGALIRSGALNMGNVERNVYGGGVTPIEMLNSNYANISDSNLEALQKEAEEGYPNSQSVLGLYYLFHRNFPLALKWFQEAAAENNDVSLLHLGHMYYFGWGVQQNYQKAFDFYIKAASYGNANAQTQLGYMLIYGHGVQQDVNEGITFFRKAAEQGHPAAQWSLGDIYFHGASRTGKVQDYDTAVEYFRQAAEHKSDKTSSFVAKLSLGELYADRCSKAGSKSDKQKYLSIAREWLNKALEQAKIDRNDDFIRRANEQLEALSRISTK